MTTTVSDTSAASADELRTKLVNRLRQKNLIRTTSVEAAFRHVPRHVFLPGIAVEQAYADGPVYTKQDGNGASISAASQPSIVAMMLEQLQLEPGHRVLEMAPAPDTTPP